MYREPDYVSFESQFIQGPDELGPEEKAAARACCAVDGYPAGEDAQGTVICNVWLLHDGQFLIDWHHNGYRLNPAVLGEIESAKEALKAAYPDPAVKFSLSIHLYVEFDDGTATVCRYHGQYDKPAPAGSIGILIDAVKSAYAGTGMTVVDAYPVDESVYDAYAAKHGDQMSLAWDGKTAALTTREGNP